MPVWRKASASAIAALVATLSDRTSARIGRRTMAWLAAACFPLSPATIIAGAILIGPLGSILGNELSRTIGRRLAISILMFASATLAATFGFLADQAYTLVVAVAVIYCVLQVSDSASITAGAMASAPPGYRGATMAVHSCIGFMGSRCCFSKGVVRRRPVVR